MKKFFFIGILAFLFTSCAEEEVKISKTLDGTWDITSYVEDGYELIGDVFISAHLIFDDNGDGSGLMTAKSVYDNTPGDEDIEYNTGLYRTTSIDGQEVLIRIDGSYRDTAQFLEFSRDRIVLLDTDARWGDSQITAVKAE